MRKLFKYPLYEILDEMTFSDITDGGAVIVAGTDVKNQLFRYDERCFTAASADTETAAAALSAIYSLFAATHAADIMRLKNALTAEYKPLDNYNMIESGTDKRTIDRDYTRATTGSVNEGGNTSTDTTGTRTDNLSETATHTGTVGTEGTTTGKTTDTSTISNVTTESTKEEGTIGNTNNVSAYDSATLVGHDSSSGTATNERTVTTNNNVTHGGDVDTTATSSSTVTNDTTDTTTNTGTVKNENGEKFTRNLTTTESGNITDSDDTTDNTEHTLTRSGNIGVTTSQQMLESEVNLRVKNQLVYYVVELFVSQYLTW